MENFRIVEKTGKETGRTVVIMAGVHGNEICGINAFEKLLPELKLDKGKAIFIYANLEAIKQKKRFVECNLNRCFLKKQPDEVKNTLEGKTAVQIMKILDSADILLDIHASNSVDSVPFVIGEEITWKFAKVMPVKIVSFNWDEFEEGATDAYMNNLGKIGLCVECGYVNDPKGQERAETAILNFLKKAELLKGKVKETKDQKFFKITSLYKNKYGPFKKVNDFADFGYLNEKTLIGHDGDKEVFAEKEYNIIFVRDRQDLGQECFVLAKEQN
ncbi:succinylglutamate desuccinylase/aspartoacylase family protein [Candidatus Woesearchaeota archaeon]|nr:succinylglutamate desuccinylase/aspartoacylase family protein [Candidatus Woesearchaeota archaeon]